MKQINTTDINDAIIKILEYGVRHSYFSLEDLQRDTGLTNDEIHDFGRRKGGLIEPHSSRHPNYCLTATALSFYVTVLDLKEARLQTLQANALSLRAYRLSVLAIIITIIGVGFTVVVALGWPW